MLVACDAPRDEPLAPPAAPLDAGAPSQDAAEPRPQASPEFEGLYRDVFATSGAARCQHAACHGGDDGNAGLSMGVDARGVYRALTGFAYGGRPLVAPRPGGDARDGSALLEVVDPATGIMPRIEDEVENRPLGPAEIERLRAWLASGGGF